MNQNPLEYTRKDISVIPLKTVFNEKEQIYTGKLPAITGWQEFCNEIPDEDVVINWGKSLAGRITGLGIVTGEASNIACIDIDTEDPKLIKLIKEVIPYTPCVIKGNPKRGGKFLYRLYDSVHEYSPEGTLKQKVKSEDGKTVADILYGNSYLCAPPSIHSKTLDGVVTEYEWEDPEKSLLKVGVHNLPIIDPFIKDKIEMAIRGITVAEMAHNMPTGNLNLNLTNIGSKAIHADGHRHDDMVSHVNMLIAKRVDPTTVIKELLERDATRNKDNPYFQDKTKGHKSPSVELNALKFYQGNLDFASRGKKISEIEIPKISHEKIFIEGEEWEKVKPKRDPNKLPPFNYKWIPDEDIRKFVQNASEANSIAPQNLFFYMLGGLSSCIGNKLRIQPYWKNDTYVETCNLYIGIIAASGERKSETTSIALKPLKSLNKHVKETVKKELEKNKQMEKDIATAIKKKEKDRNKEIEDVGIDSEYAAELLHEINELKKRVPKTRQASLYEQNTTIQKLYEIAEDNQEGLFIEWNEFGTKWGDLQAKGNESEKNFFLDGWDGRRSFMYKTKHHGENSIDELCLSVGFSGQFDVIENVIDEIKRNPKMNDGFLPRFLMFCSDRKPSPPVDIKFTYPDSINATYENSYYMSKSETPVCLDDEGYDLWMQFLKEIQKKKENEPNGNIESSISKYTGYILRICGVLETMKAKGHRPHQISADTFKTAWQIIEYAEAHLRYLFALHENRKIDGLISMLKTGIIEDETTIRELYRHHQGNFGRNAQDAMKVLEKLCERGAIKIVKDGRTNKIKVNPTVFTT